jgi:serine/threonine protein kinase
LFHRGKIIGKSYLIRHLIAEGGMAEIYLAQNQTKAKKSLVAIKRLRGEYLANREIINRFEQEGRLLLSLNEALVLRGLDYIHENGEHLIIMEFVRGKELGHFKSAFNNANANDRLKAVLAIGILVSKALSNLGKGSSIPGCGFIHGDISPENIMISFHGQLKIVDFGLSFLTAEPEVFSRQMIIANRRYRAPELMTDGCLSEAGDVYSLSLVLSELLGDQKDNELSASFRETQSLLAKGLSLDPTLRFRNMAELLEQLLFISKNFSFFKPSRELRTIVRAKRASKLGALTKKTAPSVFITLGCFTFLSLLFASLIYS